MEVGMPGQVTSRTSVIVVLVTCPDRTVALRLSRSVVAEGLAACVNIIPGLTSVYRWQGKICQDREVLLILKTRRAAFPSLARRITSLHPYTVPELLGLPVAAGGVDYLAWVESSVPLPSRRTQPPPRRRKPRSGGNENR
jgi:periplasmic divalent cation tolerance protein